MEWIDEQIKYWQNEIKELEKSENYTIEQLTKCYQEIINLNWLKLQILINKEKDGEKS